MYPFSKSVTPAAKKHMEAQLSFFNDMSKSLFRTVQQYSDLNIQLAQTMLEEGTQTSQQVLTAQRPAEAFAAAAAHAQPATEKLRVYQQHLSRLAADTQVDLASVSEQHITETSRTAKDLADEVKRAASEETEKNLRGQQDAVRNFTDPFQHLADGFRQSRGSEANGISPLQSAGQSGADGRDGAAMHGAHGMAAAAQAAAQAGKQAGARKET